jgi:peroxiredoxin
VFGISLDSPWSQRAFAASLGLSEVTLLSDALAEATTGFGVLGETHDVPKAVRSAFLLRDGTVVASWMLGSDLPDVDAIIAASSSS